MSLYLLRKYPHFLETVCFHQTSFPVVWSLKYPFLPQSLSAYNENQDITRILDNMDVYVLPVMNPDGYHYTWTTVRIHEIEQL